MASCVRRRRRKDAGKLSDEGPSSSPPKLLRFCKVIVNPRSDRLQIPIEFARRYGADLPKRVCLRAPMGPEFEVELISSNGETWFHKGWDDFKHYYSLDFGHILVFQYEVESRKFNVLIFDMTASEIEYPPQKPVNGIRAEYISDDDDDDDDDSSTSSRDLIASSDGEASSGYSPSGSHSSSSGHTGTHQRREDSVSDSSNKEVFVEQEGGGSGPAQQEGGGISLDQQEGENNSPTNPAPECATISSVMTKSNLLDLRSKRNIPAEWELRVPKGSERPNQPPPGFMCFYEAQLKAGLRFPLHPFLVKLSKDLNICLSQLTPNAVSVLIAYVVLLKHLGKRLKVCDFHSFYYFRSIVPGEFYIGSRGTACFLKVPPSPRGWKTKYFFVRHPQLEEVHRIFTLQLTPSACRRSNSVSKNSSDLLKELNLRCYHTQHLCCELLLSHFGLTPIVNPLDASSERLLIRKARFHKSSSKNSANSHSSSSRQPTLTTFSFDNRNLAESLKRIRSDKLPVDQSGLNNKRRRESRFFDTPPVGMLPPPSRSSGLPPARAAPLPLWSAVNSSDYRHHPAWDVSPTSSVFTQKESNTAMPQLLQGMLTASDKPYLVSLPLEEVPKQVSLLVSPVGMRVGQWLFKCASPPELRIGKKYDELKKRYHNVREKLDKTKANLEMKYKNAEDDHHEKRCRRKELKELHQVQLEDVCQQAYQDFSHSKIGMELVESMFQSRVAALQVSSSFQQGGKQAFQPFDIAMTISHFSEGFKACEDRLLASGTLPSDFDLSFLDSKEATDQSFGDPRVTFKGHNPVLTTLEKGKQVSTMSQGGPAESTNEDSPTDPLHATEAGGVTQAAQQEGAATPVVGNGSSGTPPAAPN